jgi:trans-aconitate methyltransferase
MLADLIRRLRVALSRAGLRPGEYSGDYLSLRKLYESPDPWRLQMPKELRRFALTAAIVEEVAPSCRTLLELGSGEGLQTEYFARVSEHVTGIELSTDAIARARNRVPQARFHYGHAEDLRAIVGDRQFDLATACEMLYYSPDAARILTDLQTVAPRVLVTNHSRQLRRLPSLFDGPGWRRLDDIRVRDTVWRCDLWERG